MAATNRSKQQPKKLPVEDIKEDEAKATKDQAEDQVEDQANKESADQGQDTTNVQVVKDTVVTEVQTPAPAGPKIWNPVPELSDELMSCEAANIAAHGRAAMLLRFTVDGKLTGQIVQIDRMHYRADTKKNPFTPK